MIRLSVRKDKMGALNKFLGISEWPKEAQHITQIFGFIRIIFGFLISLTGTFLILFILDSLGFKDASIVITVMLTVQLIADYPTGVLSDHVGQRWILGSSIFLLGIGVFILSYATTFPYFIISGAIIGFANGESSGSLRSWYDNNYHKFDIPSDPEKKEYGYTMNRLSAAQNFVMGITFIIGGLLATSLGRVNVFKIEGILCGFLTIFIFIYMKDIQEKDTSEVSNQLSKHNFIETFKGGISFLLESKQNMIFIFGIALESFGGVIWFNLILFPLYFGYSGSDKGAGLWRSFIFFISVGIAIAVSELTKKVDKKRMNLINLLSTSILIAGIGLLLHYIPLKNQFSLIGIIVTSILFLVTIGFLGVFYNTLFQRVILDFIPSKYRNSLYSTVPSLVGLISIYFLPLTGALIEKYGLQAGLGMNLIFSLIGIGMMEIAMRIMIREEITIRKKQKNLEASPAD